MAKPRQIDGRIWNDERFHRLDPTEKLLVLYSLTSQANRIGIFKFSVGLAAEDIGLSPDAVRAAVFGLCRRLGWRYDDAHRVLYIPTWWKYNEPSTENILKGMLEDLHELPSSPLVDQFCENLDHLREDLHAKFREACARHRPVPVPADEGQPASSDSSPAAQRATPARAPASADNCEDMVLPIYIGTGDAHASAREAVIRTWAVQGPERLFFRR